IGQYLNRLEASAVLNRLRNELGYWNAQEHAAGQNIELFIEVNDRQLANELVLSLRSEGFALAEVVGGNIIAGEARGLVPAGLPAIITQSQVFQAMSPQERTALARIPAANLTPGSIGSLSQRSDFDPA